VKLNPVAAVLVALAVLGIIIAVRGTQDNLASALVGHQVGTPATTTTTTTTTTPPPAPDTTTVVHGKTVTGNDTTTQGIYPHGK
jgi:hypothetical protein